MMTLLDSSLRNASSAPSAAKEDVREDMSGHLKEVRRPCSLVPLP